MRWGNAIYTTTQKWARTKEARAPCRQTNRSLTVLIASAFGNAPTRSERAMGRYCVTYSYWSMTTSPLPNMFYRARGSQYVPLCHTC
eukprot:6272344-Pyramimonas_sp.AAC.1